MKERKSRVEDALAATRAAIEEGVVVGGGVALLRAVPAIEALQLEGTARLGADIVARALREPLRIIASNAGLEGQVVVNTVAEFDGRRGLRRPHRNLRKPYRARGHRPHQGCRLSLDPCDVDRDHRPQHRRAHRRRAGARGGCAGRRRPFPRRRNGRDGWWHGRRHGLLIDCSPVRDLGRCRTVALVMPPRSLMPAVAPASH